MTLPTRRRWIIALVLLTGFATAEALGTAFDRRAVCERASEWVELRGTNLPASYTELSAFPLEYRRAIFASLSPSTRSNLFRHQLRSFAANRQLTDAQVEVIELAIRTFDPAFYAANGQLTDAMGNQIVELQQRIAEAFEASDDRDIFSRFGPADPTGFSFAAWSVRLGESWRSMLSAHAGGFECTCTKDDPAGNPSPGDGCSDGYSCVTPANGCDIKGGCGTGSGFTCNGLCHSPGNN